MRLVSKNEGPILGGLMFLLVAAGLVVGFCLESAIVSPGFLLGVLFFGLLGGALLTYREIAEIDGEVGTVRLLNQSWLWRKTKSYRLAEFDTVCCGSKAGGAPVFYCVQLQGPKIGILLPPSLENRAEIEKIAQKIALEYGLTYDPEGLNQLSPTGLGWSDRHHRRRK